MTLNIVLSFYGTMKVSSLYESYGRHFFVKYFLVSMWGTMAFTGVGVAVHLWLGLAL
jgi:hypothetical protein